MMSNLKSKSTQTDQILLIFLEPILAPCFSLDLAPSFLSVIFPPHSPSLFVSLSLHYWLWGVR